VKFSTSFFPTQKEVPVDATIPSHILMLRAGLIRPLAAGVYSHLPIGLRVMQKVMQIIREEMNAIGGQELFLPGLNPIELWEETGRVHDFGDIMFHVKNRPMVLAPTHEEVICSIAKNFLKSYRDMPQIWYQIQTKFRNEPRPRSGVLRGRQFLMKDSYSMDSSWEGLDVSYDKHAEAYKKIFSRCGLKYFIVGASSGAMGGSGSQEFMVESPSGEDTCAVCPNCNYAANVEVAVSNVAPLTRINEDLPPEEIHTPDVRTIAELVEFLKVPADRLAKSLVYMQDNVKPVLVLMVGNDQLNETKLTGVLGANFRPMHPDEIVQYTGAHAGSLGPIGLKNFRIIADNRLKDANGLISGANKDDYHIGNIDLKRDVKLDEYYDLREVQQGESCVHCGSDLRIVNAIEIGHIFKLGTKYAESLKAYFLSEKGEESPIIMGSYGIGVERIIASHIEQNHDENGIIWDKSITPFQIHLIGLNMKNEMVREASDNVYQLLLDANYEIIYDDRDDVTAGFKFKDADLLGMPLQVIIGEKNLQDGNIEIKVRRTGKRSVVPIDDILDTIHRLLM
jgi:prolyl-tRNA synthetase